MRKLNLSEKTTEKPWINLFSTNKLATRGMDLTFIPPTVIDGVKVVEISTEDIAKEEAKWKSASCHDSSRGPGCDRHPEP